MIVFDLECEGGHGFEGWFDSSDAFEMQRTAGLLECPMCATKTVTKRLSAPRLNLGAAAPRSEPGDRHSIAMASAQDERSTETRAKLVAAQAERSDELREHLREHLRTLLEHSDNVGDRFAEEARRIHYKETPERQIHGSATREETVELLEEGIPVLPVPFSIKRKDELN